MAPEVFSPHQHRPHASWIRAIQLDDHSLALFRIGLGLLSLINVVVRANYPEFLAGAEAIDLSAAVNGHQDAAWSLHWLLGSSHSAQLALLAVMGLCSLGVAVGYRTPMSTVLLLIFTVSLHNSNPLIIDTGDRQLATALLWACLLPVGRVWSVDRLLRPAEATAAKPAPDRSPTST